MAKVSRAVVFVLTLALGFLIADVRGLDTLGPVPLESTAPAPEIALATRAPTSVPTLASSPIPGPPARTRTPTVPRPTRTNYEKLASQERSAAIAAAHDSLFDSLMVPLANEANRRRAEYAKSDPEHSRRVIRELNADRVNFLLYGYGETHEPPRTERAIIGSQTIVSYDLKARRADVISLTHDIRAPEIERELAKRGVKTRAVRIDQAYSVGGFKLMRLTLENATGLAIDYQVSFRDAALSNLIDGVFGGVEVDVPMAFDVHPFYLDGKKYDKGQFAQGVQRLSGRQVVQFIKTVPIAEGAYHPSLEHNVRKALVLDALMQSVGENYRERMFWLKGSAFLTGELLTGSITYDFDPIVLIVNNIGATTASFQKVMGRTTSDAVRLPAIGQTRYVVDPAHGDGGVQWAAANAAVNPITKKDIENGVYPSLDFEVPIDANPYGNLVTEYWPSVRSLVRDTLLSAEEE